MSDRLTPGMRLVLDEMKNDPHYLWRCNAEVAEFSGFGKKKPEGEV